MWLTSMIGGGKSAPPSRFLNFEVQSFKVDHWITEAVCTSEAEAQTLAKKLLVQREGVRVLREFRSPATDVVTETIIFSEMRERNDKVINIAPIEDAPVCTDLQDFLRPDSRRTISRLLKQYLERRSLTASELLYNPAEIKRVMNFENLVPSAVSRTASLQVKVTGQDVRERRDIIYEALGELRARAETAAKRNLPTARQHGFGVAMAQVGVAANGNAEEADYLAKVVLCHDLVHIQNLLGKIEWLLSLVAEGKAEPWHAAVLDGLISDALTSPAVVQDLLGRQPDLGTALVRLVDVIEGKFEPQEREAAPELTAALSKWLGSGGAPQTRQVLIESLLRSLGGSQPLVRADPPVHRAAFQAVAQRLLGPSGFLGGPPMAESLTSGYLRFIEQGGGEGRRISIDGVLAMLPTGAERLQYLIALSGTPLGGKETALLEERAGQILAGFGGVNALMPPQTPLKPKMQMMAHLWTTMSACGLPEASRTAFAARLDDMVADYIVQSNVIEKLDDPAAPLRVRATRLVQFAAADVLASPKARRMVRDQIINHLRQPNFDGKFVEGLSSVEEKADALKQFYTLLRAAQFM